MPSNAAFQRHQTQPFADQIRQRATGFTATTCI
jgi:hypothetical protein